MDFIGNCNCLCWGWKTKTYEDMIYEVEGEFFLELCSMYSYAYFILLLPLTGMAYQKKSSVSKNIVWPASSSSYHDIMGAKCYVLSNCTPLKLGADSSNQILLLCRPTPNLGFPDFSWSFLVTASIMGLDVGRLDTIHYINGRENSRRKPHVTQRHISWEQQRFSSWVPHLATNTTHLGEANTVTTTPWTWWHGDMTKNLRGAEAH